MLVLWPPVVSISQYIRMTNHSPIYTRLDVNSFLLQYRYYCTIKQVNIQQLRSLTRKIKNNYQFIYIL